MVRNTGHFVKELDGTLTCIMYEVVDPCCKKHNRVIQIYAAPAGSSCLLYTSPSPRDKRQSRMPSSA